MSTPIGHSLFGATLYYLYNGFIIKRTHHLEIKLLLLYILLSNLPDIDFIPGLVIGDPNRFHHIISHTMLFILGTSLLLSPVVSLSQGLPKKVSRNFIIMFSLLTGHIMIDFFTQDTRYPIGIAVWWPYPENFSSPYSFIPPFKRELAHLISMHNVKTVGMELLLFGMLFIIVYYTVSYIYALLRKT